MKFKKIKKPVFSSDLYYDLFDGGYIKPEKLLSDKNEIKAVCDAIELIKTFLNEAHQNGVLITDEIDDCGDEEE